MFCCYNHSTVLQEVIRCSNTNSMRNFKIVVVSQYDLSKCLGDDRQNITWVKLQKIEAIANIKTDTKITNIVNAAPFEAFEIFGQRANIQKCQK